MLTVCRLRKKYAFHGRVNVFHVLAYARHSPIYPTHAWSRQQSNDLHRVRQELFSIQRYFYIIYSIYNIRWFFIIHSIIFDTATVRNDGWHSKEDEKNNKENAYIANQDRLISFLYALARMSNLQTQFPILIALCEGDWSERPFSHSHYIRLDVSFKFEHNLWTIRP